MTAICPRCGTVCLVGMHATRFTCKVCRLHFCNECRHWQVNRKQSYCARCGAAFSIPPPAMPQRILAAMFYTSIGAALFLTVFRLQLWQIALVALLPSTVYTAIYLAVFYRRTGLTQATRRETILLIRRTLTLAAVVYIAMTIDHPTTLVVGVAITAALVLIGLIARRSDAPVIRELQANRPAWETLLSISNWDALWMRFPDVRRPPEEATR